MTAELAIIASNVEDVDDSMEHVMLIHTFDVLKEQDSSPKILYF